MIFKRAWFLISLLVITVSPKAQKVAALLTEGLSNPICVSSLKPYLSWQLLNSPNNTVQIAYELKVTCGEKVIWSSQKVISDQTNYVTYTGPALGSARKYTWKVRVWDNHGNITPWSLPAYWQMGLLKSSDWTARWISASQNLFTRKFNASGKIKSAIAFITAHGMYEAHINGHRVGDAYFTPGWTSYDKRLQYRPRKFNSCFTG